MYRYRDFQEIYMCIFEGVVGSEDEKNVISKCTFFLNVILQKFENLIRPKSGFRPGQHKIGKKISQNYVQK